jgi:hypothetical protein
MAVDYILSTTNSTKTSLTSLKKKLSNIRTSLDSFDVELSKLENKLENINTQAEIYKSKVEREMGREVRRLERELALLRKEGPVGNKAETSETDLQVATTIGIFDTILRHMCSEAEDFRLASEAFLFPAVYERIMEGKQDAYYLDEIPACASLVMSRGRQHIEWFRQEYETHITDPDTWKEAIEYVVEWWRNDALPLIYGSRDEQWDIDLPLTLTEILLWRDSPGDRPLNFPKIFDAYEIYRKHKDEIYGTTGLREFELKLFTFETETTPLKAFSAS